MGILRHSSGTNAADRSNFVSTLLSFIHLITLLNSIQLTQTTHSITGVPPPSYFISTPFALLIALSHFIGVPPPSYFISTPFALLIALSHFIGVPPPSYFISTPFALLIALSHFIGVCRPGFESIRL
ncbi:hypothetical protein PGT21_016475 [Puccinia graminis f. sp. tritici]|uniref:Uncharacterized protein n=1 Tax=Puccinia graminis f. sp. tritici TaxID=56615 RepID=A0A5B0QIM0_PUCGR|nr:hypothetical protein PGT21_016475 [Puccinia graminis f. sp. tritici]